MQRNNISSWLQTGVRVIKTTAGSESEELYFEFVPDYPGYSSGADPLGYQIYTKAGATWTSGVYKVEITDRATGKAEAFLDGSSWKSQTHDKFKTVSLENYQMGSEPKQSVARNPGSSGSHGKVSQAKYKDGTGWHNTNFAAGDVKIHIVDGKGVETTTPSTAGGATDFEFHAKWIDGQTFEMWDERDW
jgi:hypothetical protein